MNVNASMLKIDGALPHRLPNIDFSGLFLSIHAKLGWLGSAIFNDFWCLNAEQVSTTLHST